MCWEEVFFYSSRWGRHRTGVWQEPLPFGDKIGYNSLREEGDDD